MENPYEPPPQSSIRAEPRTQKFGKLPMVGLAVGMFAGVAVAANKGLYPIHLEPLLSYVGTGGMIGYLFGLCATALLNGLKRLGVWK